MMWTTREYLIVTGIVALIWQLPKFGQPYVSYEQYEAVQCGDSIETVLEIFDWRGAPTRYSEQSWGDNETSPLVTRDFESLGNTSASITTEDGVVVMKTFFDHNGGSNGDYLSVNCF